MKKIIFLTFIGALSLQFAQAKKLPGYFISKEKDTIRVTYDIPISFVMHEPDFEKIQWVIPYRDAKGNKNDLKPNIADVVCFTYDDVVYKMLTRKNTLDLLGSKDNGMNMMFLRIIVDGANMQLFQFNSLPNSPGNYNSMQNMTATGSAITNDKYILQKTGDKLFRPRMLTFAKEVSDYLSDYPVLADKVAKGVLKSGDVEIIVKEYNAKK